MLVRLAKRQPKGSARINWANPRTRGLVAAYTNGREFVTGRVLRPSSALSPKVDAAGYLSDTFVQGGGQFLDLGNVIGNAGPMSYVVWAVDAGGNTADDSIVSYGDYATLRNTGFDFFTYNGTGWDTVSLNSSAYPGAGLYKLVGAHDGSTNYFEGYYPGSGGYQTASAAAGSRNSSTQSVRLGDDTVNSRSFSGTVPIVLVFNRALTAAERRSLVDNPWQVFEIPAPRSGALVVPAGGTSTAGVGQTSSQAAGGLVATLSAVAQAAAQAAGSVVVTAGGAAQDGKTQAIGGAVVVVAGAAQAASQAAGAGQAVVSAAGAAAGASQASGAVVVLAGGQARSSGQAAGGFVVVGAGAAQAAAQASGGAVVVAGGAAQGASQATGQQAGASVVVAGVSAGGAQAGGGAVVASTGFAGAAGQAIAQAVQVVTGRAYSSSQAGAGVSTSAAGASSSASQATGTYPNVIAMPGVSASYAQAAGALPGATVPFVFEMEFERGAAARKPRRLLEAKIEPILQRMLAKKLQRVRPAGDRAAKRARRIELEAATLVLNGATEREVRGKLLEWEAQRPYIPPVLDEIPPLDIFMSQVGFRIEQAQAMLDAQRVRQQDEDALIAIVLALQAGI